MSTTPMSRRDFARLFAAGGSAALLGHPRFEGWAPPPSPVSGSATAAAVDWPAVRAQFLMPPGVSVLNAANLCPSPGHVLEAVRAQTAMLDSEPLPSSRSELLGAKERTRDLLASFLRVTPEEILLPRNTSEANNWISTGLDLGPGDEVVIFSDNHPSNNQAWKEKARRFGYAVVEVPQVNPHPGAQHYLDAFERALTPRTRVMAFMQHTNTVGDVFPARELCALARERDVLSVVDGAQSFGLMDVDLSSWQPDFFSGSAHKWPCGPKETGVLFVSSRVHERFWPSVYSAYTGGRGLSRTHEGLGQRDTPALRAFGDQIEWLQSIGMHEIEARSRGLATRLYDALADIDGVRLWTSDDPARRGAVVTFRPAALDARRVLGTLESEGIVAASRGGSDRDGIRFSPHFYNDEADVDRAVDAIRTYVRRGL
jgi:selenocysteine lyase/cysteine desulfurase